MDQLKEYSSQIINISNKKCMQLVRMVYYYNKIKRIRIYVYN